MVRWFTALWNSRTPGVRACILGLLWSLGMGLSAAVLRYELQSTPDVRGHVTIAFASAWLTGLAGLFVASIVLRRGDRRRSQAIDELHDQQGFLQRLIDAIPVPVYYKDLQGRYIMCNKACGTALGLPVDQILGKTVFDILPADLAEQQHEADMAVYRAGKPQVRELTLKTPNDAVTVLVYRGLVHGQDGWPAGLVATILDVTRHKQIEEDLQAAREETEAVNRQLQKSLAVANEMAVAAEHASHAKSEFLANMSHEIRTPLTAILGYSEILLDSPRIGDEERSHLNILHRNGEHLLSLINDILDLSKIEAGKSRVNPTRCSIIATIADVVSTMRLRATEKNIALTVEYPTPLPEVILADEAQLRQILVNLLGNAVKFTHRGGIRIVSSLVPQWRDDLPAVRIEVIDSGIGITPADISRLCQPFFQADTSMSRQYGGTGLGLAITKRLIEAMNGELTITSTLGQGSIFAITLPVGATGSSGLIERPAEIMLSDSCSHSNADVTRSALVGLRILLAEDGPDNQLLLRTLLTGVGAEVEVAGNGRVALEKALAGSFDLILMDIQMPEMDGYEASEQLRRGGCVVPIIALTAHVLSGERERCLSAGCTDYLSKPVDRTLLIHRIQEHTLHEIHATPPAGNAPNTAVDTPASTVQPIRSEYADDPALTEVISVFVAGLPAQITQMRQALEASDFSTLQRLAHQLKGAGGGYGYPCLTRASREVESAAKTSDREVATTSLHQLALLVEAVASGSRTLTRETSAAK